jgi:hypothetical protein
MFEVEVLDLLNNNIFSKWFYDPIPKDKFINKCKYSTKVKVISVTKY